MRSHKDSQAKVATILITLCRRQHSIVSLRITACESLHFSDHFKRSAEQLVAYWMITQDSNLVKIQDTSLMKFRTSEHQDSVYVHFEISRSWQPSSRMLMRLHATLESTKLATAYEISRLWGPSLWMLMRLHASEDQAFECLWHFTRVSTKLVNAYKTYILKIQEILRSWRTSLWMLMKLHASEHQDSVYRYIMRL